MGGLEELQWHKESQVQNPTKCKYDACGAVSVLSAGSKINEFVSRQRHDLIIGFKRNSKAEVAVAVVGKKQEMEIVWHFSFLTVKR